MEFLNKAELRGIIGSVRITPVGDTRTASFAMVTNFAYKNSDGMPVIETTWHRVTAFEANKKIAFDKLEKGAKVHVTGRFRAQRYTDNDGSDRVSYDIFANAIDIIPDDEEASV